MTRKGSSKQRILYIVFEEEFMDKLQEWKRQLLGNKGFGSIKKRIEEVIVADLKKMGVTNG